jgi:hypothetical protein
MEDRVVRSAGRPPWLLGGVMTTGGLLSAGWHLHHVSSATQAVWCAFAAITVGAGTWRLYVQVQVDLEWLRRLREGNRSGRF